jgi:O-methyltransferase
MLGFLKRLLEPQALDLPPVPLPVEPSEIERLAPYALGVERVLLKQQRLARDVISRAIPGDLVECGVFNGGSAAAMATAIREGDRRLWLYDSFEGMPKTTAPDGATAAEFVGACKGEVAKVLEALAVVRFPKERAVIRKGWFQDTVNEPLPEKIALLHLDCDWYESVLLALRTLYDRVPDGGVILLDDFGHWEGCREAFYDFTRERDLKPLLERFSHTQAFWVKGRAHNRDFVGQWELP